MDGPLKLRLPYPIPLLRPPPSVNFAHSRRSVSHPTGRRNPSPPLSHWHTAATFRRPAFGWRDLRKHPQRRSDDGRTEWRPFMAIMGFLSDLDDDFLHTNCQPHVGQRFRNRRLLSRFLTTSSTSYIAKNLRGHRAFHRHHRRL